VVDRVSQNKRLQYYLDNGLSMENFEWAVRNIYKKVRLVKPGDEPQFYYLVRWAPTNFNAPNHQNEFPLK
jgi:hypothetical protein